MPGVGKNIKINNKNRNWRSNINQFTKTQSDEQSSKLFIAKKKTDLQTSISPNLSVSFTNNRLSKSYSLIHNNWPLLPQSQSELFFECTLFLYSVLALFLQYLNLYKTLWWLPKSHWHVSMKFYLINPYLLSCIGLLLGMRVSKCFWNSISNRSVKFMKQFKGWTLKIFQMLEWTIQLCLIITVLSSFFFSFSRVLAEFGIKTLLYFIYPFFIYFMFFHRHFFFSLYQALTIKNFFTHIFLIFKINWLEVQKMFSITLHKNIINVDLFIHSCSDLPSKIREEADILLADFDIRFKRCVFTGLFTAYFAILMPRAFIPEKSVSGEVQYMLINDDWVLQLCIIVLLTGFLLYATYLFPIKYFDLLHKCVIHLGYWKKVKQTKTIEENAIEYNEKSFNSIIIGKIVLYKGVFYQACGCSNGKTVAAIPGDENHLRLYRIGADPVQLVSYVFIFQILLIGLQFWALILSTDWQKIVTLVLLMFANYLLLAKIFKDRLIIGRIYNPNSEDLHLALKLQKKF